MKRLQGLLLVMGMVGCEEHQKIQQVESRGWPQSAAPIKDPIAAFVTLGAGVSRNNDGSPNTIYLDKTPVTDAALVHLSNQNKLILVSLCAPQFTDAGLVNLRSLTSLEQLHLTNSQVTAKGLRAIKPLEKVKGALTGEYTDYGCSTRRYASASIS